jgi:CRP-like cAMP-binding protein
VGEYLYREAGPRRFVYKVEKGVVVIFERQIGRPVKIIAIAGEGDYFGLGCLEHHRDNARAVVESVVSYVPRTEFSRVAERDPKLKKKQDEAIARDFEQGKLLARDRGTSSPIECVAAFLVALSRQNAHEGRDASLVYDSGECVSAASLLLDMEAVAFDRAVLGLRKMGLIEPRPEGLLRLKNISALERIADGELAKVRTELGAQAPSAAKDNNPVRWRTEVRKTLWLASVIAGLSVIATGLTFIHCHSMNLLWCVTQHLQ